MPSLATALRQELKRLLEPLVSAAGSTERWALLLALVGHTADAADDSGLGAALDDLGALTACERLGPLLRGSSCGGGMRFAGPR